MKITEQNFIIQLKKRNETALEYVLNEFGNLMFKDYKIDYMEKTED